MLSFSLSPKFPRLAAQQAERLGKTIERLSSANRVNRAADDAAGLSIAESLRTQVRGAQQAARNIEDGISILKVGVDGVQGTFTVLHRLRELILQAANGTYSDEQLGAIQNEMDQLKRQIPEAYRIAVDARIAYDGTPSDRSIDLQIGANHGQTMRIDYNSLRNKLLTFVVGSFGYRELYNSEYGELAASLTFPATPPVPSPATDALWPKRMTVDPNSQANIDGALRLVDQGLRDMVDEAAYLGAQINRLEHELHNVRNQGLEMAAGESRIRDADMAGEASKLVRQQITGQAAQAMVAQAHAKPTAILELVLAGTDQGRQMVEDSLS